MHGCMNFCANRGLTCKMYGRVLKIDFVPVFNTISRARICMNFQTVFADSQVVVSSTKCIRSWVRCICTVLQRENLNYRNSNLKISPVLKNQTRGVFDFFSEFFMRACMRSGNLKQIYSLLTSLLKPQ